MMRRTKRRRKGKWVPSDIGKIVTSDGSEGRSGERPVSAAGARAHQDAPRETPARTFSRNVSRIECSDGPINATYRLHRVAVVASARAPVVFEALVLFAVFGDRRLDVGADGVGDREFSNLS